MSEKILVAGVADDASPLVLAIARRIAKRQAEYEAANEAWQANHDALCELDGGSLDHRAAFRARMESSKKLNARCEWLSARLRKLHQLLWKAESQGAGSSRDGLEQDAPATVKISPPGRLVSAVSGCLKEPVSFSTKDEGVLTLAAGGNRVGYFERRASNIEGGTSKVEDGRASA